MIRRHSRPRRHFWRNNRGATAVEFSLLALPLIMLIFASMQTALLFFYDQALQTGAQKSARQLLTGSVQLGGLTQAQFKTVVCANLPSQFQCSNVMVDVQSASSFQATNTSSLTPTYDIHNSVTNVWNYTPGNPGDIVIMRVMYDWPVLGGPLAVGLANQPNNTHLMVATTVFKNEPYQ